MKWNLIQIGVDQIFIQVNSKIFFSTKLDPNINPWLFLNVSNYWIELKIFFRFVWLNDFKAHWDLSIVVKYKFFSINMIKQTNLKIIQRFFDTYWNFSANAYHFKDDRWRMNKIIDVNFKLSFENSNFWRSEFEI